MDHRTLKRSCESEAIPKRLVRSKARHLRGSQFAHTLRLAAVCLTIAAATVMPRYSEAALMMKEGTTLPGEAYLANGARFAGQSVWIKGMRPNGEIVYFTGLRIDGGRVLTFNVETHSSTPVQVLEIGNGTNYRTNPGDVRAASSVVLHPQKDASIVFLSGEPFPGIDFVLGAAPQFLEKVEIAGFGKIALLNGPVLDQDGGLRAFEMVKGIGFDSLIVNQVSIGLLNLPGGAKSGDSGSPIVNAATGLPFAIALSASQGTGSVQIVDFLSLESEDMRAFMAVPETSTGVYGLVGGLVAFSRRARRRDRSKSQVENT